MNGNTDGNETNRTRKDEREDGARSLNINAKTQYRSQYDCKAGSDDGAGTQEVRNGHVAN